VDVGTSGGVWGLERGYCLMIGAMVRSLTGSSIFASIAPGVAAAERTPGRAGEPASRERISALRPAAPGLREMSITASIGSWPPIRGLNILKNADAGLHQRTADAETAPLEHPEFYRYDWPSTTWPSVASWQRDPILAAGPRRDPFVQSPDLADSPSGLRLGEGRWTAVAGWKQVCLRPP